MINLYLVRHGITQANINHVFQKDNEPLAEAGIKQVKGLSSRIKKSIQVTAIYSSPMYRAVETAKIISKALSVSMVIDDRIREIESASVIKGKSVYLQECLDIVKIIDKNFLSKATNRVADEETFHDILDRVKSFMFEICEKKETSVLIITHHRLIAFMLSYMFGQEKNPILHCDFELFFHLENASIVHVQYDNSVVNRYTGSLNPWRIISIQ